MKAEYSILIFLSILFLTGCEENLLKSEFRNTPEGNFEALWNEFDVGYGAMHPKEIPWDSLKQVYGSRIDGNSDDRLLFETMCGLLHELNDGHTDLYAPGIGYFRSWHRRNKSYYKDFQTSDLSYVGRNQQTIRHYYLENQYESVQAEGWLFFYGTISRQSLEIGYLCIPTFNLANFPDAFIQSAIDAFRESDAVIIDLRFNGGGTTESFVRTLNGFAAESKVFVRSKYRNGPSHTDFSSLLDHRIDSRKNSLNDTPVAILMNSFTASSSEHFILGMKSQQKVVCVGDTTCGAFSSVNERLLPNGWRFRIGGQVLCSPEGTPLTDERGVYLEGHGIAPDHYEGDSWLSLQSGDKDRPLEKALEVLSASVLPSGR